MRQEISIPRNEGPDIRGVFESADSDPIHVLVLAHGAGAGMNHRFMEAYANAVVEAGIAVLRYEFPYITEGQKRPDVPAKLTRVVRTVAVYANNRFQDASVFAGGKSLGGRMTSTAEAAEPLGVRGIVFVGFPLHAPGRDGIERAAHLAQIGIPMLFLQGTRDRLAEIGRMRLVVDGLRQSASQRADAPVDLFEIEDADHSFRVPKRSGMTDSEVLGTLAHETATWIRSIAVN